MGIFNKKSSSRKKHLRSKSIFSRNETTVNTLHKKKTLVSQLSRKRMGVIPQIQSIDEATDQIKRSTSNYNGIYWILTLIMFVLYFFYRQYKRRNIKSKIALRKRDSVGNEEDDPEFRGSTGTSQTIGLEMKSITATRILPTLRGLPTSKTGIKATSIIDKGMLENIVRDLPTRYAICDWNLIYSSPRDGIACKRAWA